MSRVVSQWRELVHDDEVVLLDGFHALKHAIRFNADIPMMITDDQMSVLELARGLASDIVDALEQSLLQLPRSTFEDLVTRAHPTRVASVARKTSQAELKSRLRAGTRYTPTIILENPRNLGNIGAVVRLAAGFGAAGVVTTGNVDPWHPNVLRGSAGLHFATAVLSAKPDDLPTGPIYALDPDGNDIRSLEIPDDALLAFGSERHGISAEIRTRADRLVSIPMRPKVSSYNLATSVAMTLFHWASGSGYKPLT